MIREVKCPGCGEWVPVDRLAKEKLGLVATRTRYSCPICSHVIYEESPLFTDLVSEAILLKKDWVRLNDDALSAFPRWGKAEVGSEDLQRVEVICYRCKRWIPYPRLKTEYTTSISVGWRLTYHCPNCGTQLGSSHGRDPSYNIAPADFEDLVLEAVREGRGWARLMSEAR
jgi:hypothetical protein